MRIRRALSRLFRAASAPQPPRDRNGRFVSDHRARVLARARQMRRDMGLPPLSILDPLGLDPHGDDA